MLREAFGNYAHNVLPSWFFLSLFASFYRQEISMFVKNEIYKILYHAIFHIALCIG